jgi:hypothetical protein
MGSTINLPFFSSLSFFSLSSPKIRGEQTKINNMDRQKKMIAVIALKLLCPLIVGILLFP